MARDSDNLAKVRSHQSSAFKLARTMCCHAQLTRSVTRPQSVSSEMLARLSNRCKLCLHAFDCYSSSNVTQASDSVMDSHIRMRIPSFRQYCNSLDACAMLLGRVSLASYGHVGARSFHTSALETIAICKQHNATAL